MQETNLRRELAILTVLGGEDAVEDGGLGVVRIADLIGREKSQVSRTLKTLAESGFVDRDAATLQYRLGWRFFALAARAGEQRLLSVAPALLERLVENVGETVHLSVLQGVEVLTVLSKSPPHAVKADGWAGRTVPIYCTSSGRALLFDHDDEAIQNLLSDVEFRELRPGTVRNVEELEESKVMPWWSRSSSSAWLVLRRLSGTSRDGSSPRSTSRRPNSVSVYGWRAQEGRSRRRRMSSPPCSAGPPVLTMPPECPDMLCRSVQMAQRSISESR